MSAPHSYSGITHQYYHSFATLRFDASVFISLKLYGVERKFFTAIGKFHDYATEQTPQKRNQFTVVRKDIWVPQETAYKHE